MQWLFQCHHPHWFHAASCTGGEQWWRYSERRGDAPWKICSVWEHNPSTKDCHLMQKNTSAMAVPDDCAAHTEKSTPADASVVTPALQILVPSPSNTPEPGRWDPQELSTLLRASPKHSHSLVQHMSILHHPSICMRPQRLSSSQQLQFLQSNNWTASCTGAPCEMQSPEQRWNNPLLPPPWRSQCCRPEPQQTPRVVLPNPDCRVGTGLAWCGMLWDSSHPHTSLPQELSTVTNDFFCMTSLLLLLLHNLYSAVTFPQSPEGLNLQCISSVQGEQCGMGICTVRAGGCFRGRRCMWGVTESADLLMLEGRGPRNAKDGNKKGSWSPMPANFPDVNLRLWFGHKTQHWH